MVGDEAIQAVRLHDVKLSVTEGSREATVRNEPERESERRGRGNVLDKPRRDKHRA